MGRLRLWWQKIKQHPVVTVIIIVAGMIGIALLVVLVLGYIFNWGWTGLGPYIPPTKDSNFQRGKTLWDWFNLLGVFAIPAVVGLGAAWYTAQQGKVSERENTDNQREAALQGYIDKMSELLLDKKLRESTEDDEVRKIARVRTLTVLPRLDDRRKRSLLQFLYESGLINKGQHVINLSGADLSKAYLRGSNLNGANLNGAKLSGANLSRANLNGANLNGVNLWEAYLHRADLREADLREAALWEANFWEADLREADLSGAQLGRASLIGANITQEQLDKAKSLQGAIMPDGSIHA